MKKFKLNLDKVTIVSINTKDPELSIKAIERSSKYINFAKYLLITDRHIKHDYIEIKIIDSIKKIEDYSYFCVKKLNEYIDTEYCLIVQPDGFVTNPLMWTDEFLKYDYIGAPWDEKHSAMALGFANININNLNKIPNIVGNGGFCLRSKRFLQESSKLNYGFFPPEDVFLSTMSRDILYKNNIKFAPLNLACRFAIEHPTHNNEKTVNLDAYFGFHGTHDFKKPLFELLNDYENDIESINLLKNI
jgi:hypothetical protein